MTTTIKDDFTATTLTKGKVSKSISGNIETVGDHDWFKLDASRITGDRVSYQFSATAETTAMLSLYDASGTLITNDVVGSIALTSGVYYMDSSSNTLGKYNFTVATIKDDLLATNATKGKVGKTIAGNIESNGDVDWFKLDATKMTGDRTTFKFVATNSSTADLALYDSEGHLVAGGFINNVANLTTAGTYYVAASGATGKYSFNATTIKDDAGSLIATAKNGAAKGVIETAGDVDLFKAAVKGGKTYEFDLKTLTGDQVTLSLLDGSGSVVATDSDHDGVINFNTTSDANYFVSVAGLGNNTGAYQVTSSNKSTSSSDTSGATTYDLYNHSPANGATYVVDAGAGSFKFTGDVDAIAYGVVVVIENFGADDSLWLKNGWKTNLSMLRTTSSATSHADLYQEHIQVTQDMMKHMVNPQYMEIWLADLPANAGPKAQAIGIASITEFNALSVGDIHWG